MISAKFNKSKFNYTKFNGAVPDGFITIEITGQGYVNARAIISKDASINVEGRAELWIEGYRSVPMESILQGRGNIDTIGYILKEIMATLEGAGIVETDVFIIYIPNRDMLLPTRTLIIDTTTKVVFVK